ncbi:AAA domain-containing protein [Nocardia harenae]|uniref:AAA domain-containing protein n=1 Tax=Nocardia harenae TaxID=358707 RepID=UPI000834B17E|nr:AAA domain-containing protein [Nocardia harenae]
MLVIGDVVVAAPADLIAAARCEFAVLRALDAEIASPRADSAAERDRLLAGNERTIAALRRGATEITDAVLFDGRTAASAPRLLRADHRVRYTPATADATDPVRAALELAACADLLSAAGALPAPVLRIGGSDFPLDSALPVHLARRERFEHIVAEQAAELLPVQWGDPRYLACGRCAACRAAARTARDVGLVAGIDPGTAALLRGSGIGTVDRLASSTAELPGLPVRTATALRRQARVQVRADAAGHPVADTAGADALAALPPSAPGDIGIAVGPGPALLVAGPELALRIPFGANGLRPVLERLRAGIPGAHLYHHGAEVRALLHAHQTGPGDEELLEELFAAEAVVDLAPIVRSTLVLAGQPEPAPEPVLPGVRAPVYRVAQVAAALDHLVPPDAAEASPADIRPPAEPALGAQTDAHRVLRIRAALRTLADRYGIPPRPPLPRAVVSEGPSSLEAALAEFARARADAAHPAALLADALGYHRRQRGPRWDAHRARRADPVADWADEPGVLVAEWGTVDTKWHRPPHGTGLRRYLTLTGRFGTGAGSHLGSTVPAPGTPVHAYYDQPDPAAPGLRTVTAAVVLGCSPDTEFADTVRLEEVLPDGREPSDALPIALAPRPPYPDPAVDRALEELADAVLVTLPDMPPGAPFDLLARRPPRLRRGRPGLPPVHGDHAAAITEAVRALDDSVLAVQAPAGTGKVTTIARVVARLLTGDRLRIGITAPDGHGTVEQLLDAVVRAGVLPELVAKKDVISVAPEWAVIDGPRYPRFLGTAVNGCVVGGLPADFADPAQVPRGALDLLIVADAGRCAPADALAAAVSARSLLLLGDLEHAGPPGSALELRIGPHRTVPAATGYLLDRTWRLHPAVCGPLSALWYDGRLGAAETVTGGRALDVVPPGIETVLIPHRGHSTVCEPEAREVVRRVRTLLTGTWTSGGSARRLHPHDIFVVAPYGPQVALIRTLLERARIDDVLVGTPERFRGREAAVVLVSATVSAPVDAPGAVRALVAARLLRGALGRALWHATIIRSPLLTEFLPADPAELAELSALLRLR